MTATSRSTWWALAAADARRYRQRLDAAAGGLADLGVAARVEEAGMAPERSAVLLVAAGDVPFEAGLERIEACVADRDEDWAHDVRFSTRRLRP